jgi:hypothetical protein
MTGPLGLAHGFFYEDFNTTLTSSIPNSNSTLDIQVADTTDANTSGFILIGRELIAYSGKTATTFTGITRGAGGSQASSHVNGSIVTSAQIATANTNTLLLLNKTTVSTTNGVVLNPANNSFSVLVAGTYDVQFSIQGTNFSSNNYDNFTVWFVQNGTAVPSSASQGTLVPRHSNISPGAVIMTVNIFLSLIPSDVVQLYWTSVFGNAAIITGAPNTGANFPIIPSTLLSVIQLG